MKAEHAKPKNVDEYLKGFPRQTQAVLRQIRRTIRKALPGAEEAISYNMPAYKLGGRWVIAFSGWKEHYSLYPSTARMVSSFKGELVPHVSGKGTLRFSLSDPVPERLIAGVVKFRAREVVERAQAKAAVPKKR